MGLIEWDTNGWSPMLVPSPPQSDAGANLPTFVPWLPWKHMGKEHVFPAGLTQQLIKQLMDNCWRNCSRNQRPLELQENIQKYTLFKCWTGRFCLFAVASYSRPPGIHLTKLRLECRLLVILVFLFCCNRLNRFLLRLHSCHCRLLPSGLGAPMIIPVVQ